MSFFLIRGHPGLPLLLACLLLSIPAPGSAEETPLRAIPGAAHPLVEWSSWERLDLPISYFNLEKTTEGWFLWFTASSGGLGSMVKAPLTQAGLTDRPPPQFQTDLVRGYERDLDGLTAPILSRGIGRTLPDGGALAYGSIGPRYRGGATELFPALFFRPPGGNWQHFGPPSGDPAAFLEETRHRELIVRAEGGGLILLPDGRYRLYLDGFLDAEALPTAIRGQRILAPTLLVAEADNPEGPWHYVRQPNGQPLDLRQGSPLPWLFPHVEQLAGDIFVLTGADAWPPQNIYAAYSRDGLHFVYPANENGHPLPLRRARDIHEEALYIKALRGQFAESSSFWAMASVAIPERGGVAECWQTRAIWDHNLWEALWPSKKD